MAQVLNRQSTVADRQSPSGLTLVEALVALGLVSLVLALTCQLMLAGFRITAEMRTRTELQEDGLLVLRHLRLLLGQANEVEVAGDRLVWQTAEGKKWQCRFDERTSRLELERGNERYAPLHSSLTSVESARFEGTPALVRLSFVLRRVVPGTRRHVDLELMTCVKTDV